VTAMRPGARVDGPVVHFEWLLDVRKRRYTPSVLRVPSLVLPTTLPPRAAIRSLGDNLHSYEPEFWEFQYEVYRYLGGVAPLDLAKRYQALIRNMRALIASERHVIPIQSFLSSWYWYRKEHHTRLEFAMRGVGPPVEPPVGAIERPATNAPARPSFPNAGDVIFRYGERQWIEKMVYQGGVRVRPASCFKDLELGEARSDEELAKRSVLPGEYSKIITMDGREHRVVGDVQRTVSAPDYYVFCCSCEWDPALFAGFQAADACAVVRDTDVFANRLDVAFKAQLDGWHFHHNPVEYFDPHEMPQNQYFVAGMCKDFRFAYQREYRFLWVHLGGEEASGVRDLELGSLQDIAEVHFPG